MQAPYPAAEDFLAAYRSESRRFRKRLAIGLSAALVTLGGTLTCLVTQPMMSPGSSQSSWLVDARDLETHVRYLAVDCRSRDWSHTAGLTKAGGYIENVFQTCGGRAWRQTFHVRGREFTNYGVTVGPESGPHLIVGAHYDACGDLPGADDNASGIAGLLELAKRFGSEPPRCRMDLIAYTLEEPPFFRTQDMGSARHAASIKASEAEVRAMVSLEMIGRFNDTPGTQRIPSPLSPFYPDAGNFIAIVGRFSDIGLTRKLKYAMRAASPLPVRSLNGPRWIPGVDFSDHHPYWDRGYSAVMVTDTAFNRNRDYHTEGDTPEKLDYRRMALVVQGVEAALRDLSK